MTYKPQTSLGNASRLIYGHNRTGSLVSRDEITTALVAYEGGEFEGHFDLDAIYDEYLAAVEAVLPDEWTLVGDEIYVAADVDVDFSEFGVEEIAARIDAIDFSQIVERHDLGVQREIAEKHAR